MKWLILIVTVLASSTFIGCSAPEELPKDETKSASNSPPKASKQAQAVQAAPIAPSIIGHEFRHQLSKSRFNVGANTHLDHGANFERVSGAHGAFFTDTLTGAVLALPSAASSAVEKSDVLAPGSLPSFPEGLTTDAAEHSAIVRSYFVQAGLPEDEIGGTHVTTTMSRVGTIDGSVPATDKFLWYTTHVERRLSGIRVEGSFAYAALDKTGAVISEAAYWPALPADVVATAVALRDRLKDATEHANFVAAARSIIDFDDSRGEVIIAHTHSSYHGMFQAVAAYEVESLSSRKRHHIRFNDKGERVQLPDDIASNLVDSGTR